MAIEIVHSRTATLIDGSNPDEIQAADWNDTHPITGDGMGLLFSNSAGAVAETMTVDMGTLTASTPLTFKQTWDGLSVAFVGYDFVVKGANAADEAPGSFDGITNTPERSPLVSVRRQLADNSYVDAFQVTAGETKVYREIKFYDQGVPFDSTSPSASMGSSDGLKFSDLFTSSAEYGQFTGAGFFQSTLDGSGDGKYVELTSDGMVYRDVVGGSFNGETSMPTSPLHVKFAEWAGAPSTSDIPAGYSQVGKDTSTGNIWFAVNDGGTIKKVQLT